jgi:hypothetical protein
MDYFRWRSVGFGPKNMYIHYITDRKHGKSRFLVIYIDILDNLGIYRYLRINRFIFIYV